MQLLHSPLTILMVILSRTGAQYELDALIGPFRAFKTSGFQMLYEDVETENNLRVLRSRNKMQPLIWNRKIPCPLNNTRSPQPPTSVHRLRPGDIDVVGGIGDSLTAGVGLMATRYLHVSLEHRGAGPTAGGKGSWRKFLTVPNILKTFNRKLTGYATETSLTLHRESQLNLGETGATSEDMPHMAKLLIKRMRANPKIDMDNMWKMITFMVGPNDFCSGICYQGNIQGILDKHRRELIEVLTILKENSPRTLVNLIPPPKFTGRSLQCRMSHLLECPCLFGAMAEKNPIFFNLIEEWQKIDMEIGNSELFDTDNFTVVVQPFTLNFFIPNTTEGFTDYSFLSEDCFHMSQKGNARIANSLWNNILEPVGKKSSSPVELMNIKCPTEDSPYIFTRRNS